MSVRVIIPPEPIVSPGDIAGDHGEDDAGVLAMIEAAQEDIDGPTGWLGRSLGKQTLELRAVCLPAHLPYRPIIDVESVTVGGEVVENPEWQDDGRLTWPAGAPSGETVIRYTAGYDGESVENGGTGKVPARAKQAIILMVKGMRDMTEHDVFQTQESVVGVGASARSVTPYVSQAIREAAENLLFRLKVIP